MSRSLLHNFVEPDSIHLPLVSGDAKSVDAWDTIRSHLVDLLLVCHFLHKFGHPCGDWFRVVTEDREHIFFAYPLFGNRRRSRSSACLVNAAFYAVREGSGLAAARFDFAKVETINPVGGQNRDLTDVRSVL